MRAIGTAGRKLLCSPYGTHGAVGELSASTRDKTSFNNTSRVIRESAVRLESCSACSVDKNGKQKFVKTNTNKRRGRKEEQERVEDGMKGTAELRE